MKNKKLLSGLIVAAVVFLIIGLMLMVVGFTTNGSAEFSGTVYVWPTWGMDDGAFQSFESTVDFNFEMSMSIFDKNLVEGEFISQLNNFFETELKDAILEATNSGFYEYVHVSIVDFEVDGYAVYQMKDFNTDVVEWFVTDISSTWIEMISYNFTNQILEITFGTILIISSLALVGVSIFNLVSNKAQKNNVAVEEATGVELEEKTE